MSLTARQLALATLDRQVLLERRRLDVAEAIREGGVTACVTLPTR
ncbi:hypothetical protein [Streptomyces himalayensis]|nr:hypothetical protein [Streptomyces himalayensis]